MNRFSAIIAILIVCVSSQARVFYVDGDYQGENYDGLSWLSAFPRLDIALKAATTEGGGEIWIKRGVYTPTENATREASFILTNNIQLYGGFRGGEEKREQRNGKVYRTILSGDIGQSGRSGDNCYHVISGTGTGLLDGLIIMNGTADGTDEQKKGAGLYLAGNASSFTISNCSFEKNKAKEGGAIYAQNSTLTITNSTFFSNSANMGGALFTDGKTQINLNKSSFSSNFAPLQGGALALFAGAWVNIQDCTFMFNSTDGRGGAIFSKAEEANDLTLVINNGLFTGNSARSTAGALFNSGPFSPQFNACKFIKNNSINGTSVIENRKGVVANITACSYTKNQGAIGFAEITSDALSKTTDQLVEVAAPIQPKPDEIAGETAVTESLPESEPIIEKPLRSLPDFFVYSDSGTQVKLKSLIASKAYTVLVTGCLTSPDFIENYKRIETANMDYATQGVAFYYLYRYLKHPENNGFIKPYKQAERNRHIKIATEQLLTQVPWLSDDMDNKAAEWFEAEGNDIFIFDPEGNELFAMKHTDNNLRKQLNTLVTEPSLITKTNELPAITLQPTFTPEAQFTTRIVIDEKDLMTPLQITPIESKMPFMVKLRAEANDSLLETGNGKMYLGFHIDPIYTDIQWNNLGDTLSYAIDVPSGAAMAPSVSEAEKVSEIATDAEPREFLLEVRKWKKATPITINATYSLHSGKQNWMRTIKQQFVVYLDEDKFGGIVFTRQKEHVTQDAKTQAMTQPVSYLDHLKLYDINRDGKISNDEASKRMRKAWDSIDTNKDGYIKEDEFNVFNEKPAATE